MRKFRFMGDPHARDTYGYPRPELGAEYKETDIVAMNKVVSLASWYPTEWEEVVEEALETTTQKLYTLDEVVEVVNNWAMVGVIGGDDVAGFFARREKQIKLNKIKELEEELKKLKETL